MSGGKFDYNQYKIGYIAESIRAYMDRNDEGFNKKTLARFKDAVLALQIAQVYAQRIDWLLSGDDGEDTFHRRLEEDLLKIELYEKDNKETR